MQAGPVSAFRIVKERWAGTALDGDGARLYGGRWNPRGFPCVYLAESRALAALELLVHLTPRTRRLPFVLIEVTIPSRLVKRIRRSSLPEDWRRTSVPRITQEIGRDWLDSRSTAVLRLPSAIIEEESLYLLNPRHPAFRKLRPSPPRPFCFDRRLS